MPFGLLGGNLGLLALRGRHASSFIPRVHHETPLANAWKRFGVRPHSGLRRTCGIWPRGRTGNNRDVQRVHDDATTQHASAEFTQHRRHAAQPNGHLGSTPCNSALAANNSALAASNSALADVFHAACCT